MCVSFIHSFDLLPDPKLRKNFETFKFKKKKKRKNKAGCQLFDDDDNDDEQ